MFDFSLIFIKFLFVLPKRVLQISSTVLFKYVPPAWRTQTSVTYHDSSELNLRELDKIFCIVAIDLHFERTWHFGVGCIETHFYNEVYVSMCFKMLIFHEESGDGRVMRDLFHIEGNPSNRPLQSLPQDRVERFAYFGITAQQKNKSQHHVLDLLLQLRFFDCFIHVNRSIAE